MAGLKDAKNTFELGIVRYRFGHKMKAFVLVLAILVVAAIGSFWFLRGRSHASIETTQVDRVLSISASAPPFVFGTGAAFAIVTGELDGTGKIEFIGNGGRDREAIEVGPGPFELAGGGAEEWIPDYGIRYTPITATRGTLYAAVYCGAGMNPGDWTLHGEVSRRRSSR